MKRLALLLAATLLALPSAAVIRYVAQGNPSPAAPYTNWTTAATTIQAAVDACFSGDTVLVSNGVYDTGTKPMPGASVSNRLVITNNIMVRSVNGPSVTTIAGGGTTGVMAVRGVYVTSNAQLVGFTIAGGYTRSIQSATTNDSSGGGLFIVGSGVASNCVIRGCSASYGGGVWIQYGGQLTDCLIVSNRSSNYGGGLRIENAPSGIVSRCVFRENFSDSGAAAYLRFSGFMNNCLIVSNQGINFAGGIYTDTGTNVILSGCTIADNRAGVTNAGIHFFTIGPRVLNCIVVRNTVGNWSGGSYSNCISSPVPPGVGNLDVDPLFIDAAYRLDPGSPARNAGNDGFVVGDTDLDGNPRIAGTSVDIGAYESVQSNSDATVSIPAVPTGAVTGFVAQTLAYYVYGATASDAGGVQYRLDWGDGLFSAWNTGVVSHAWTSSGVFSVRAQARPVSNPSYTSPWSTGFPVTIFAVPTSGVIRYVAQGGLHLWPFMDWATAATNIQAAVDACSAGDTVLVSNGVYSSGFRRTPGYYATNRLVVTNRISVHSVNGPAATWIVGAGTSSNNAIRCVYLTSNANLSGFTLANGFAGAAPIAVSLNDSSGGGLFIQNGGTASNCIIENCQGDYGGGVCINLNGSLLDSTVRSNRAITSGGGLRLYNAVSGLVDRCRIDNNFAYSGGGAFLESAGRIANSLIADNRATNYGGAVQSQYATTNAILTGCTIAGNRAPTNAGLHFVGTGVHVRSSILWGNSNGNWAGGSYSNCIATPLPPGAGNLAIDPQFVDADYRVAFTSPSRDKGNPTHVLGPSDLDGQPRISATNDIGAYEIQFNTNLTVTVPDQPFGPTTGLVWQSLAHTAFGAEVSDASPAEYQFDWGDGTFSDWNTGTAWRVWENAGAFNVRVQARPAYNPEAVSGWSTALVVTISGPPAIAATRYVALGGGNIPPYTNWFTAATTLQAAVDYAQPGDLVLVSNGVYNTGERITPGGFLANRVVITNNIVLRSANGSGFTFIQGGNPHNTNRIRCVFMTSGRLEGFSLTNGLAYLPVGDQALGLCGGGAHADGGTLVNCLIAGNRAGLQGGGVYRGRLINCNLTGNFSHDVGGAAAGSDLVHCTVRSNGASVAAGGVFGGSATNCIVYSNTGSSSENHFGATLAYSCSWPLPPGPGNTSADPLFIHVVTDPRLRSGSPCIDTALPLDGVTNDFVGSPRPFDGDGDGSALPDMGAYEMVNVHYVAPGGLHIPPFTTWANAATTIQAAVDVAQVGGTVLVSNGLYAVGGRVTPNGGTLTNRVTITNTISLRSVNGPAYTVIQGAGSLNTSSAVRCVYISNTATVWGFTLTGGFTRGAGSNLLDTAGGGIFGGTGSVSAWVSNCVIAGCAAINGGGAAHANLIGCEVAGNTATNAGGGVYNGSLDRCRVVGNTALGSGGGTFNSRLTNCLVVSNTAYAGGGVVGGSLLFCTVADNAAWLQGGVMNTTGRNSIVYFNTAFSNANQGASMLLNSCTLPLLTNSLGSISNAPVFMGVGDYRLRADSPCIDRAANNYGGRDLTGALRPVDGNYDAFPIADMGAYEYNPQTQDSDGDGILDAAEVAAGSDPVDAPSFPADVSGTVVYGGSQTGAVYLLVDSVLHHTLDAPGVYAISNLPNRTPFALTAYLDASGNGQFDPWEPAGAYTGNPLVFTQDIAGVDLVLVDDLVVDSDGDGLTDYAEVYVHFTEPYGLDTDGDGFGDGEEFANGSDPRDAASALLKASGTIIYAGALTGTVVLVVDGATNQNLSAPGPFVVSNLVTRTGHIFAAFMDVDGNALADPWEPTGVHTGNPVVATGDVAAIDIVLADQLGVDTDGDGLTDYAEVHAYGTDPSNADTDNDGLADGFEVQTYGTDPNDADTDDDGFSDGEEYIRGTNPGNVRSPSHLADFDGDGRADLAVHFAEKGDWHILESLAGTPTKTPWGSKRSVPTPADYDGDGDADIAFFLPDSGDWYLLGNTNPATRMVVAAPVPVPADYDGDGIDDLAVYQKTSGDWHIRQSASGQTIRRNWGWADAMPVPADYDGDGKDDLAVYHPASGNWHILASASNVARVINWGWSAAQPVPGDYNGDGRADLAVFHRLTGQWYLRAANGQMTKMKLGSFATAPVPADYDGDGKTDPAVYQPSDGAWLIQWSSPHIQTTLNWGWRDARPVLRQYQINKAYGFIP